MAVSYKRKELVEAEKRYSVIRDCLAGEITIKARGTQYLPVPNADEVDSASARYIAYRLRATFYGVTKRTLDGLCGQIFVREPVIELEPQLQFLIDDVDGAGVSLVQQAKEAVQLVLAYGRCGLLCDYPAVDGAATKAQIDSGEVRPTIALYAPWHILNWRTRRRGAKTLLCLVVLEECYLEDTDAFESKEVKRWRVLRLVNNGATDMYVVELWEGTASAAAPISRAIPLDYTGNPFTEIPFLFAGAVNNDDKIDDAPMYDIASLNIAHYRNSADYEESAFMVGQPTPVLSGLSEDWVKNVLKGKVHLGSRGAITLPPNASAELLQASPNTLPFEAMQHKEKQMVALGARLVEQRSVVRTASEANIDQASESSVLASTAKNVATAITHALKVAASFIGASTDKLSFSLNTDFDIATMSSEDRRQLIDEWQAGAVSWGEVRTNLRKSGIATLSDEEARSIIDEELAALPQPLVTKSTGAVSA
jgi:hypothetical protein